MRKTAALSILMIILLTSFFSSDNVYGRDIFSPESTTDHLNSDVSESENLYEKDALDEELEEVDFFNNSHSSTRNIIKEVPVAGFVIAGLGGAIMSVGGSYWIRDNKLMKEMGQIVFYAGCGVLGAGIITGIAIIIYSQTMKFSFNEGIPFKSGSRLYSFECSISLDDYRISFRYRF